MQDIQPMTGEEFLNTREFLGLTRNELAEKMGVTHKQVRVWEHLPELPALASLALDSIVQRKFGHYKKRPNLIGTRQCCCGYEKCRDYWLTGFGKFVQGSGFEKEEAQLVANLLNKHRMSEALGHCD